MGEADDNTDYADTEFLYNQVMEQALTIAVGAVGLRPGGRVLDAGCGPGGVLPLLAAAVAHGGHVLGLDLSAAHVARAARLVRERELEGQVTVAVADLCAELPIEEESFDAVWSADVLYPDTVGDSAAVVERLGRALKPGGTLAIFYGNWLRSTYLPSYARLEHLICAARETLYARERRWQGEPHPERALGWLERAGLTQLRIQTFPVLRCKPLPDAVRRYVASAILGGHYARSVAECGDEVGMIAEDRDLWRRLSDPASPDFILDQPDYYCVATPLLALGQRPS